MPTTETVPASGTATGAAAQVLNRRILVIREAGYIFGFDTLNAPAADAGRAFRAETTTVVNNLPNIYINLFLLPEFNDGVDVWRARNFLEWRPVFDMPPDAFGGPNLGGIVGIATGVWIPLSSPMIIPVGVPIVYALSGNNIRRVALEVRVPDGRAEADQGSDMIVFSISAGA